VLFSAEVQNGYIQQDISAASTIACNTETAEVKHKSQTHFLLTATSHSTMQSNNQSGYLLVVGFATATIITVG